MIEKFPYLAQDVRIIRKYNSVTFTDTQNENYLKLNDAALSVLRECDGKSGIEQIISNLAMNAAGDINDFVDKTTAFFEGLSKSGLVFWSDVKTDRPVNIIDVPNICYPNNIVFELTDFCNLNCKHCYRNSGPSKTAFANAEKIIEKIGELKNYGLRSVHFTGGEPTTHGDFNKILTRALELNLKVVILSNGTNFSGETIDIICGHKNRIIVQVDLDGADAEIHDDLRGSKGAFDKVTTFIKTAAVRGIPIEVAMNIYKANVDFIEKTAVLAKDLGAASFTCSPIMECGRGANIDVLDDESIQKFLTVLNGMYGRKEDFIRKPELDISGIEKRRNCGGGHTNLVCSPVGDIRPCVLMPVGMVKMGNLFEEEATELFAKPVFKHFAALQAPTRETCSGCKFEMTCLGCFSKILLNEEKFKKIDPDFHCKMKAGFVPPCGDY
jgi:radical SAM protein with 4Fe4S-binding SPASM domain